MRRSALGAVLAIVGVVTCAGSAGASSRSRGGLRAVIHDPTTVLTSSSTEVRFKAGASADTFALYGGPGSVQGKFQEPFGNVPDAQGWLTVDVTDQPNRWQLSTFNATNLHTNGPGNVAYWCGRSAAQEPGWSTAPGYGNGWNEVLLFTSGPVADSSVGQVVGLDFYFNYDLAPNEDYFRVEYQKNGVWVPVYTISGSNRAVGGQFDPPGVQYSTTPTHQDIVYDGFDYGGTGHDEILLRLRVTTDASGSDQDGTWDTSGAVQVDDITVSWTSDGPKSVFSTFQGGGPFAWRPQKAPFAGDFAKQYFNVQDVDPCRDNVTPVFSFIDDGTPPSNPANQPPIQDPPLSTGGSLSPNWSYGVSGGWVLNYNGGISFGVKPLHDEIWSPPIAWDLSGTADDDPAIRGAVLRFSVWRHLPIENGIFYVWHVRSSIDGGLQWSPWRDRSIVYWDNGEVRWYNHEANVTELLLPDPTHVQIALGVRDLADLFGSPGNDATPAPLFDNATLLKYRMAGPLISAQGVHLLNDSFSQSGQFSFATPAERDGADCRLDMAFDINPANTTIVPGDSIVATIVSVVPQTEIESSKLVWILDRNPLFDDVRQIPPGTVTIAEGAANGWDQWSGEVAGSIVSPDLPDRVFFDPPDADFMYPGDVLRYYLWARDTQGNESTLPAVLTGFDDGVGFDRTFTVHALPSGTDDGSGGITIPPILIIQAFGHGRSEELLHLALAQNGWIQGRQFDIYTPQSPTSRGSNGIGSSGAHGATPDQLGAYSIVLYLGADLSAGLLSDGSGTGGNDKSDDIGVLADWEDQDADRFVAYFGDDVASALQASGPAGQTYLQSVMGVEYFGDDVRADIDGQRAPAAVALVPCFFQRFIAFAGCDDLRRLDNIGPLSGAARGHGFAMAADPTSTYGSPGRAASVLYDRADGNGKRKINITFPYGLDSIRGDVGQTGLPAGELSVRADVLRELVSDCFGTLLVGGPAVGVDAPSRPGLSGLVAYPNPFNPRTTIRFTLGASADVRLTIFDLKGQQLRTLHQGRLPAGEHQLTWDGEDGRGVAVSSGVYLLRVASEGAAVQQRKLLLLR